MVKIDPEGLALRLQTHLAAEARSLLYATFVDHLLLRSNDIGFSGHCHCIRTRQRFRNCSAGASKRMNRCGEWCKRQRATLICVVTAPQLNVRGPTPAVLGDAEVGLCFISVRSSMMHSSLCKPCAITQAAETRQRNQRKVEHRPLGMPGSPERSAGRWLACKYRQLICKGTLERRSRLATCDISFQI
jgi:hypothetical protein